MKTYDKIPRTLPDRDFPTGDVSETHRHRQVQQWFDKVGEFSSEIFSSYIKAAHTPTEKHHQNARFTNPLALIVTQHWGTLRDDKQNLATKGYMTGCAFIRDTGFLPDFDRDLRASLGHIRSEIAPETFAENTWAGMARSHPNVFAKYEKLYELGTKHFELGSSGSDIHFIAGLGLSYMLSAAAWLETDAKISNFSGLANDPTLDLRVSDFKNFFVSGEPLAPDVIIPKK